MPRICGSEFGGEETADGTHNLELPAVGPVEPHQNGLKGCGCGTDPPRTAISLPHTATKDGPES